MSYNELTDEEQDYYDLELLFTEEILKQQQEKIKEIKDKEDDSKSKLLLLLLLLFKGKKDDDKLQLTEEEIKKYKDNITKKMNSIMQNEIDNEIDEIENILKSTAFDSYNTLNYIQTLGEKGFDISKITDSDINKIINETIDNKTFKDRTNDNKTKIFNIIKEEIFSFLTGVLTVGQIKKLIDNDFKTNQFNTDRLVNNEISRVLNTTKDKFREDNGIKKVIYCSVLEATTCSHCEELNGTIYDLDDKNRPKIPEDTHIYCKCFYITLADKDWKREDKTDILYENYLTWKSENGLDGDE